MTNHSQGRRYKTDNEDLDTKKRRKKKKINILLIIFIVLFMYSVFIIARWVWSNISAKKSNEKIREEVVQEIKVENTGNTGAIEAINTNAFDKKIDFEKLAQINQDIVGYIDVPNTNISYPIVQADDNDYYLNRDIYKNYNSCGSVFMDYTNNPSFTDNNTVLFGHNLKTGMMFANLNKILRGELGGEIYINIYTKNKNYHYQMFAIYTSKPIKNPINTNISNMEEFINNAINKSEINCNVKPSSDDRIITLSTCGNSGNNRVILHGVKILEEIP